MHLLWMISDADARDELIVTAEIVIGFVVVLTGVWAAYWWARDAFSSPPAPPPPPPPRFCRKCGVRVISAERCDSPLRLPVTPRQFDTYTGKRWYANNGKGIVCSKRGHIHSIMCTVTHTHEHSDGPCWQVDHQYSEHVRGLHITHEHDSDAYFLILDPPIVDEHFAALSGTCGREFCGACGQSNPTRADLDALQD